MAQQTHCGHEYVDLGLPSGTLWATCNVGATNPENYGDYFAWGETTTKTTYNWSTYNYCEGNDSTMTKYCTRASEGIVDSIMILEATDDAAKVHWGGDWRTPTYEEQMELCSVCNFEWININGVDGYKVTNKQKQNTNSIFLPAAGNYEGIKNYSEGQHCFYWSSSLYIGNPTSDFPGSESAHGLALYGSGRIMTSLNLMRFYGIPVRAVLSSNVTSITSPMVNSEKEVQKLFENGMIYILRNGEKYTIDGRRL